MDTWAVILVLILLAVGVLLIIEVRPYYSRQSPEEETDRSAHREELKELHRMRRQRDRIWFRIDDLHAEFVKRTLSENPTMEDQRTQSPSQASDGDADADNWNDVNPTYMKEKYESFLKKD